jgi:D-glycero-D-manno-heptose 1,7-bisphosphate phosphatase
MNPFNLLPAQTRLLIFDADNTLRRTTVAGQVCPYRPGEWELLPKVRATLQQVDWRAGWFRLGIASNQDQVAYGHLSEQLARRLLIALLLEATGCPVLPAAIQLCPHALEVACPCRKPAPGMLLALMAAHGLGARHTILIGDAACDREAARRAGVRYLHAWEFFGNAE